MYELVSVAASSWWKGWTSPAVRTDGAPTIGAFRLTFMTSYFDLIRYQHILDTQAIWPFRCVISHGISPTILNYVIWLAKTCIRIMSDFVVSCICWWLIACTWYRNDDSTDPNQTRMQVGQYFLSHLTNSTLCIRQISHAAQFCNRNVHTHVLQKVHCGIRDWCIVGFAQQVSSVNSSVDFYE